MKSRAAGLSAILALALLAAPWRLLARFVDAEGPAADLPAVHDSDGGLGVGLRRHLDEGEPARAPGVAVGDDLHIGNFPPALLEERAKLGCIHVKREIAYV